MPVPSKLHIAVNNVLGIIGTPTITPAVESETPESNILDSKRGKIVRITGSTGTVVIKGSSADAYTIGCFLMWGHNCNEDNTVRFRLYDGINQTGSNVYDSGVLDALVASPWGDMVPGIDPWGDVYTLSTPKMFADVFDNIQFKSYQIDIDNSTNSVDPLDIGLIYGGITWSPSVNVDYGADIHWMENSQHSRTAGGGIHTDSVEQYRQFDFQLSYLSQDDQDRLTHFMTNFGGKANDIFVTYDPTDTGRMKVEGSMLGRRSNDLGMARGNYAWRQTSLAVEEL